MIVKYLTSSKLTRLQLRDAAFRRTLLVQCLVLLHACAHPKHAVNKAPLRQLREKQASLLYAGILLLCCMLLKDFFFILTGIQSSAAPIRCMDVFIMLPCMIL